MEASVWAQSNSTSPMSSFTQLSLSTLVPQAQLWYSRHRLLLEFVFVGITYSPLLLTAFIKVPKQAHARKKLWPFPWLVVHTIASVLELLHYYVKLAANGGVPLSPTPFEVFLCLVQSATSIPLMARVRWPVARATFHLIITQRVFATGMAAYLSDGAWNKASIKLIDNFMWLRWVLLFGGLFQGMTSFSTRYTGGMLAAHVICLWEGDYPHGIPTLFAGMVVLLRVNKWAADQLQSGKAGWLPRALDRVGLVTPNEGEQHENGEKGEYKLFKSR